MYLSIVFEIVTGNNVGKKCLKKKILEVCQEV